MCNSNGGRYNIADAQNAPIRINNGICNNPASTTGIDTATANGQQVVQANATLGTTANKDTATTSIFHPSSTNGNTYISSRTGANPYINLNIKIPNQYNIKIGKYKKRVRVFKE